MNPFFAHFIDCVTTSKQDQSSPTRNRCSFRFIFSLFTCNPFDIYIFRLGLDVLKITKSQQELSFGRFFEQAAIIKLKIQYHNDVEGHLVFPGSFFLLSEC